jgi:hypothetical protein
MNPDTLLLLIGTWLPWLSGPPGVPALSPRSTVEAEVPNIISSSRPAHCIDEVQAGQMEPYPVDLCEDR